MAKKRGPLLTSQQEQDLIDHCSQGYSPRTACRLAGVEWRDFLAHRNGSLDFALRIDSKNPNRVSAMHYAMAVREQALRSFEAADIDSQVVDMLGTLDPEEHKDRIILLKALEIRNSMLPKESFSMNRNVNEDVTRRNLTENDLSKAIELQLQQIQEKERRIAENQQRAIEMAKAPEVEFEEVERE